MTRRKTDLSTYTRKARMMRRLRAANQREKYRKRCAAGFELNNATMIKEEMEDYGPSAFLVTEMTENGLIVQNFKDDIKEESSENIDDIPDNYADLWQVDAALIAEELIKRKAKASMRINKSSGGMTDGSNYKATASFECAVCSQHCDSKKALRQHLRIHGKKMDCRLCAAKISSIQALRQHLKLKKCKGLNAPLTASPTITSINNPRQLVIRVQSELIDRDSDSPPVIGPFNCEICPES